MKKIETNIEGLFVIKLNIFKDERGFFVERYNKAEFERLGINEEFVQDNHSSSLKSVVRGLHAQKGQSKLVGVISGSIFDVAVDIRKGSKTYGQHFSVELSAENGLLLWIPDGFLHGFQALTSCEVMYKVTSNYSPQTQFGVNWSDPAIGINWPDKENALLNPRDSLLPNLSDIS